MKDSLLLLMSPNMSLQKWHERGQLSRELGFYNEFIQKAGIKLIVYSYGRNDQPFLIGYPNIGVISMPEWIPKRFPFKVQNFIYNLTSLFYYRQYFRKVVIAKTNQLSASNFGLVVKLFYNIPLVIRMGFYHSHFKKISLTRKLQEFLAFQLSDLILTTSSEAGCFIVKTYKVEAKKVLSMCNSIDLTLFKPLDYDKEYDLIFVGRLEKVKNIEMLINVIKDIKLKTLIIGSGSLNLLVEDAKTKYPHIAWKERVDNKDLPEYYNKARCFLLLSEYEGNPKALLEAMACGLPSVGTRVPGIRECINHEFNGVLVDKDIDNVKCQILKLFNNKPKAQLMGKNAFHWVKSEGDSTKNIDTEIDFYFKLLSNKN